MSDTVPASTPAPSPSFAQLFGPVFWGFCVSLLLSGVSALQGYIYFTRHNDKLAVRMVAGMMLTLDFLSMALICQSMYYYMLPHFGSFAPLSAVTNELNIECLISAVITFTSQMYFAYQLHMVKNPGWTVTVMKLLVVILGLVGLAGATGCVVMMFVFPHNIFMNRNHTFAVLAGVAKGFGAAADIVATVAMCLFLDSAKTGMKRTSSLLRSLMQLIINRGILVTAAQILLLITFFATSGHLYWLAVHINTTKLYVNTFFAMLNARNSLKARYATGGVISLSDTTNETRSAMFNAQKLSGPALNTAGASPRAEKFESEYLGQIRVTTSSTVANI